MLPSGTSNDAAHTTQYVYDEKNRKTEEILPDPDDGGPLPSPHTWYYYDGDDRLQAVVNAFCGGRVGEPLPRLLVHIGSQQAIGGRQTRLDEPARQRRGHLSGADQSDSLFQHARAAVP